MKTIIFILLSITLTACVRTPDTVRITVQKTSQFSKTTTLTITKRNPNDPAAFKADLETALVAAGFNLKSDLVSQEIAWKDTSTKDKIKGGEEFNHEQDFSEKIRIGKGREFDSQYVGTLSYGYNPTTLDVTSASITIIDIKTGAISITITATNNTNGLPNEQFAAKIAEELSNTITTPNP